MSQIDLHIETVTGAIAWLEVIGDCIVEQLERQPRRWKVVARKTDFKGTFTDPEILDFARQEQELQTRLGEALGGFAVAELALSDKQSDIRGAP